MKTLNAYRDAPKSFEPVSKPHSKDRSTAPTPKFESFRLKRVLRAPILKWALACSMCVFFSSVDAGSASAIATEPDCLPEASANKSNIVPILCDDLGYGDVQRLNPKREKIKTPNVDRTVKFFVDPQTKTNQTKSSPPVSHSLSRMPEFSWGTLPLYIHIRKKKKFTDEELQHLAGFPLITLEKTTGSETYGSTDVGTIEAAKAIKRVNPNAKVLFYRNVFVHYGGYSFDDQLENIPGWFLETKRGTDKVVRKKSQGYDTSNEALRKWWVDSAAKVCKSPHVDGLFLDGNIKSLTSYLKGQLPKGKKEDTVEGYHDMITATRRALGPEKLMLANVIRARFPQSGLEYMNYFDGTYLELFTSPAGTKLSKPDYIAKGIEATQTAARAGKIVAMTLGIAEGGALDGVDETHSRINDLSEISQQQLHYKLALFLVCAEKYSYLFLNDGYCVDTRGRKNICQSGLWLKSLPEYQKPLGPPKGPAKRIGYVYTRDFEHASVWLDIEESQGKITWK